MTDNSSVATAEPSTGTGAAVETVASTGLRRPVPLVLDIDEDPLAGIPEELFDKVGSYDSDTAGGCG